MSFQYGPAHFRIVQRNLTISPPPQAYRGIQRLLGEYKDARRGPTVILIQSPIGGPLLTQAIPTLEDFPSVLVPHLDRWAEFGNLVATVTDCTFRFRSDGRYPVLDWQRVAAKRMVQQFLNTPSWLHVTSLSFHFVFLSSSPSSVSPPSFLFVSPQNQLEQARYAHIPLGNLSKDPSLSITDVFFARHLLRHNHILWVSPSDKPDLGGGCGQVSPDIGVTSCDVTKVERTMIIGSLRTRKRGGVWS